MICAHGRRRVVPEIVGGRTRKIRSAWLGAVDWGAAKERGARQYVALREAQISGNRTTMCEKAIWIRRIYAVCLLGATVNHAEMLWEHGMFWDYGGVPLVSQVYWTSLTVIEPLAVLLLFLRPVAGLGLALAIIVSDVIHNTWLAIHLGISADWMYYSQVAFLLFVSSTIRTAWHGLLLLRSRAG